MPIRDIEEEIREMGVLVFLEKAKQVTEEYSKDRMMIDALDHESLAFMKYIENPNTATWLNLLYEIEYHRVYFYNFSDDYYPIIVSILDKIKGERKIVCPNCGAVRIIDEWRRDAWRCRGCAEYLPYDIRSKYFKRRG